MKFFVSLLVCGAVSLGYLSTTPRLQAAETVSLEDHQKLQGDLGQLQEAYTDLLKRFTQLSTEMDRLRTAFREERENNVTRAAQFVTNEQLKELISRIKEVDDRRVADNKKVIEAVDKELHALGTKLANQPVYTPPKTKPRDSEDKPKDPKPNGGNSGGKEMPAVSGEFYPHKVASGESFSAIVSAYNAEFKKQGKKGVTLEQVRKANPKVNINKIYVGQEILIPAPEK